MKPMRMAWIAALACTLACGDGNNSTAGSAQGQSHWLESCEGEPDCGGLACICGVCIAACDDNGGCSVEGRTTRCQSPDATGSRALCGAQAPTPICLESCGEGCPIDQRCEGGVCVPAESTEPSREDAGGAVRPADAGGGDAAASGSGGEVAGTGGNGGSSGGFAGSSVDCDCLRGAYFPVCGSDGQTHDATCGRECVPVAIACDGECPCSDDGELHWFETCGDPVCGVSPDPSDDPTIPNCTTEQAGDSCSNEGEQCDGVLSCGASLICAASDPTMAPGGCPRSRARFKEGIEYLSEQQRHDYHMQLMSLPLASYRYKHAEAAGPQLGFIIEDIEPSVAVSGDHVNMYGYLSMAVAAIQVQQEQITSLQRELERLRARLPTDTVSCGP